MTELLRLTVLTPARTLAQAEDVAWVQARLADGCGIGIYPGHAPLLAETVTAPLRYADPTGEHALDLEAGILQIERGSVTIFTRRTNGRRFNVRNVRSGLARREDTGREHSPQTSQAGEERRFDRLAQALLDTLQEDADEVLGLENGQGP
jgi:F0F1-type ATP synthase epsilon subunit